MSTILVVGVGPLPSGDQERIHAPGLRLQWTLDALRARGDHKILLAEFSFDGDSARRFTPVPDLLGHRLLPANLEEASAQLAHWMISNAPDGVIALTDIAALAVVNSGYRGPIYVDYNGHPMTERQQQAFAHGSNESLADQWLAVLPVLLRADRFATCSPSQRLALLGELGAVGRLNAETCGQELVDVLPVGLPFSHDHKIKDPKILQKWGVPEGARVILSTGGFNTWFDEATLFRAVNAALSENPNLHFVATGGAIPGHVEIVFDSFMRRVEESSHFVRFHFPGWVRQDDLLDGMMMADVAVNCDLPTLEGELGSRNRLLGWAWMGLRIVSTITGGPSRKLAKLGLLKSFDYCDAMELAKLLTSEALPGRHQELDEIRKVLRKEWDLTRLYAPLMDWADEPVTALDRLDGEVSNPLVEIQRRFLTVANQQKTEWSIRRKARELAQRLGGSRLIKMQASMNPETKKLLDELMDL